MSSASSSSGSAGKSAKRPSRDALGPLRTGYPAPVDRLIDELAALPGIGRRSAERLALSILKNSAEKAASLAGAIADVKRAVRSCAVCDNLASERLCSICSDETRQRQMVMVVEQPRDVLALEQTGVYRGLYHVLLGRISPLEGVGPGDLTIAGLMDRIARPANNAGEHAVTEVILGLNPTLEGDGTAMYLAEQLKRFKSLKVSRLARGLPTGVHLEHATKAVLADAIEGRGKMV